jgi:uncharacterized protein (TIGR02147 family)
MTDVFQFRDYRDYLRSRLEELPSKGYGQLSKLARSIGVNVTLTSQIMKGSKSLSIDQAVLTAQFFGLSDLETDYFIALVSYDRAGRQESRAYIEKQLEKIRRSAKDIDSRMKTVLQITTAQRAEFYSSWVYSAVRQSTAIDGLHDPQSIATYLGLQIRQVRTVLEFLSRTGLCVEKKGRFYVGAKSTHLNQESPWARVHKSNWHEQALRALEDNGPAHFIYSQPVTLSKEDAVKVRGILLEVLERVNKVVDPSASEELFCLNLDWFKVGGRL